MSTPAGSPGSSAVFSIEEARQAVEAGAADRIDGGIAGQHIGEAGGGDRLPSLPRRRASHPARVAAIGQTAQAERKQQRRGGRAGAARGMRGRRENSPPIQKTASVSSTMSDQGGSHERPFQVTRFVESIAQFGHRRRDLRPGERREGGVRP